MWGSRPFVRPSFIDLLPAVKQFLAFLWNLLQDRLCKNVSKISGLGNSHALRKDVDELLPTASSYFLTYLV
jgi:hypothetical protein